MGYDQCAAMAEILNWNKLQINFNHKICMAHDKLMGAISLTKVS